MEPLFEAKALVLDKYTLYHIYRINTVQYRAELITDENGSVNDSAPLELFVTKSENSWQTDDLQYKELAATIGAEIDVFNNGYGAILGRIGIS